MTKFLWMRRNLRGDKVSFIYTVDARNNVTLSVQEVEGLMRSGNWELIEG